VKVLAGIDGGGTRTRLALVNEGGGLLSYAESASCSFVELGLEGARNGLAQLWQAAWAPLREAARPADALFMGMGSILSATDARTNCELAESLGFALPGRVRAENDAYTALAGGLLGRPGILLISGTGSACVGRDAQGKTWRAGGWGHLLGEAGSAYALGLEAMIAATHEADGRSGPTALGTLVREALGLQDMAQIYRRVHGEKLERAEIAALAPHVVKIAASGDSAAIAILKKHASGLVDLVSTVSERLRLKPPLLALTGGLITSGSTFRQMFLERLEFTVPWYKLAEDGLPPVLGAVLLAKELEEGTRLPARFIENLRLSSRTFSKIYE
jgi:N-acetylglucosamine kinase-like BadF-type ATPase